jgi:hypothetical protein
MKTGTTNRAACDCGLWGRATKFRLRLRLKLSNEASGLIELTLINQDSLERFDRSKLIITLSNVQTDQT